jgi:phage shock protein C
MRMPNATAMPTHCAGTGTLTTVAKPRELLINGMRRICQSIFILAPCECPCAWNPGIGSFFDMKKLYRIPREGKISGVCAGLAEFFEMDPAVMRLLVVVLALLTGFFPTIIAYAVVMFVVPVKA